MEAVAERDGERHDKRQIDFSADPERIFLSTYKLFSLLTRSSAQKREQLISLSKGTGRVHLHGKSAAGRSFYR